MKKIFSPLLVTAAVLMTFSSCQKESDMLQDKPSAKGAIMTVSAGSSTTKTAITEVSSTNYKLNWTAGDAIACYEVSVVESTPTVQGKVTSSALDADTETASFTFDLSGNNGGPDYSYIFVYPAEKYTLNQAGTIYRAQIPDKQTFSATSFDKDADVLISRAITGLAARPTTVQAQFERIGATALMNIKTPSTTKAPSTTEIIREITFSTTESGAKLYGYIKVDPLAGTHETSIYNGGNSLTLTPASSTTYSGTIPVWFRLGEVTLTDNFTVKVTTDKKIYTKVVDLAGDGRSIEFHNSGLTKFNVDMSGVAGVVPSFEGDYLIGSYSGGKWHLMSSVVNSNNYYQRYETSVAKEFESVSASDFIAAGISTNDYCWKVEENASGYSIKSYKTGKYVSLTKDSNNAYAADALDGNTYFTFSVNGNITTITSTKFDNRYLRYNTGSPRFAFYTSSGSNISLIPCDYETRTRVSAPTNVQASASGNTITVIWDDASDANIGHYLVTLSGDAVHYSQDIDVGDEVCEFTGLSDGTYSVSVTAISNDNSAYLDSEAVAVENILVGDPKGTPTNPYTASEILSNYPQGSGNEEFYVSGTITGITDVNTQYGNATYTISDGTNSILVYRGNYLNNASFTSADQIAENDQVIIYGKIGVYQNTPQMAQGNYLYSLNGKTKVLTAGNVTATPDNSNKQITVTWTAATGSSETISYHVTCGTQTFDADAAGSHTFTMADYGTYDVTVEASASDAISATVINSVTLSDGSGSVHTARINFGSASGSTNVKSASVSGSDSEGNTWTVTTQGTTSFTANESYAQIGSSSKPASSITFTTTLPSTATNISISGKFGGFNGTAGTITLKVGNTSIGSGSLNAANDVTVSSSSTGTGTVLTVTVTGISKGVKAYWIEATYTN